MGGLKSKVAMKIKISPTPKNNHRKSSPSRIKTKNNPKNTKADPASG
jgi:hypothetical protein